RRRLHAMAGAEALDPGAPGVVEVGGDHPDREAGHAGHPAGPDRKGQVLDQEGGGPVVRAPGRDQPAGLCRLDRTRLSRVRGDHEPAASATATFSVTTVGHPHEGFVPWMATVRRAGRKPGAVTSRV